MRPEGWKQQQLSGLWGDAYLLMLEFGFASLLLEVVQVPDCNQLARGKIMAATIDMPMVKLAGISALNGIAHVLEGTGEERIALAELDHCLVQRAKQFAIEILPVRLATHYQVGGAFDRIVVLRGLTDTPGVLIVAAAFESVYHFTADIKCERVRLFEDKTSGCNFVDGWGHSLMHAYDSVDSNPIRA